jgi:hypothetical protein
MRIRNFIARFFCIIFSGREAMHHIGITREETRKIAAIIAELDAAPGPAGADRRERPRIDYAHPMWLCLPENAARTWAHVHSRNLSTGGLAFLTRNTFYAGQHVVISHLVGERTPQLVFAAVRFVRAVNPSISEVGVEFLASVADPKQQRQIPADWMEFALKAAWAAKHPLLAPLG